MGEIGAWEEMEFTGAWDGRGRGSLCLWWRCAHRRRCVRAFCAFRPHFLIFYFYSICFAIFLQFCVTGGCGKRFARGQVVRESNGLFVS
jgi:hypothetical protein